MWLTYGHGICALPVQRDPRFVLCPRNVHRMYLTGVLLAAKLMDDNVFNNPYWAKVTPNTTRTHIHGFASYLLHDSALLCLQEQR